MPQKQRWTAAGSNTRCGTQVALSTKGSLKLLASLRSWKSEQRKRQLFIRLLHLSRRFMCQKFLLAEKIKNYLKPTHSIYSICLLKQENWLLCFIKTKLWLFVVFYYVKNKKWRCLLFIQKTNYYYSMLI